MSKRDQYGRDPRLKDFRNFLYLVWQHLRIPAPVGQRMNGQKIAKPTPLQYQICEFLQHGPRRRGIEAFRGIGKSWITIAYCAWRLYWDPHLKIEVVSASKALADNFSISLKGLIWNMPQLQFLRPREGQRQSNISFDVGPALAVKDPSVKSVGITGMITGTRAGLIIADDIETPSNSFTEEGRERLAELVKEFESIIVPEVGEVVYLGTPHTEQSLYNTLHYERGYEFRIWPARVPDRKALEAYGDRLAPALAESWSEDTVGEPTDSERFTQTELRERELSYGRSGFQLQFMLDTSLADSNRHPLKLNDLLVTECDTDVGYSKYVYAKDQEYARNDIQVVGFNGDRYYKPMARVGEPLPYMGKAMFIDPSGRGSDETGYAVAKNLNSYLHITACGGLEGGYENETLTRLAKIAKEHDVERILIEDNFGDGMFTALFKPVLRRVHDVSIEEVKHHKQKELRIIDTLEPVMNRHRLIIDPKVLQDDLETVKGYPLESRLKYTLAYQMSHITKDRGSLRHDDRLDALAGVVTFFTDRMSLDEEEEIKEHNDHLLEQELERFMEISNPAYEPSTPSWFD